MIKPLIIQPFQILLDGRDYTQLTAFTFGKTEKALAVVGCVDVQFRGRRVAVVRRLYVHADYRRRGLGRTLMQDAINLAKTEEKCKNIALLVQPEAWAAGAGEFYDKLGFTTVWQDPDGELILSRPLEAL